MSHLTRPSARPAPAAVQERTRTPARRLRPSGSSTAEHPASHRRRGMALLAVLAALAVLALLLLAVGADVLRAQRAVRRDLAAHVAFAAAEQALYAALATWPERSPLALAEGGTVAWSEPPRATATGEVHATAAITRLSPAAFRIDAEARIGDASRAGVAARRGAALLVALDAAVLPARAAVVTLGAVAADATARLDGRDTLLLDDADCAADSGTAPGVLAGPGAGLALAEGAAGGEPPTRVDAALDARSLELRAPTDSLAPAGAPLVHEGDLASATLAPALDGEGRCDAAARTNWGDPRRRTACAEYRPVVHVRGDLLAPAGVGQGVLVVDGDLELHGTLHFAGVIVVRGTVRVAGGAGDRIVGTLLLARPARDADGVPYPPHRLDGLQVRWSACAVRAARRAAGVVRPVAARPWRPAW